MKKEKDQLRQHYNTERSIQLCVLTAYLAAKDNYTEQSCFDMLVAEIQSRPSVIKVDQTKTKLQISTGFRLYKNHPKLTSEQVLDAAVELYISMIIN